METLEKDIKERLIFAARRCQQNFYELLSDWNIYDQKRPQCLKNFIGIALFGPPKIDDLIANKSFSSRKNLEDQAFFHDPHQQSRIHKIYEKIVRHGIQNTAKKEIMCGLIYNVTFDMFIEGGQYFSDDHVIKCLQPVPIFKVLKNVVERNHSGKIITKKLAIYYIDDSERVYKNWYDYLSNNLLPECIMVLPKGGEYQGDYRKQWSEKMSYVWIEIYESPACKTKAINTIDSINKFVSLGCAGVGVAAVFNPVGATVVALSALGMGLSGLWSIGRSSHELADRHLHEQTISIKNKNGFIRWFGVASSALAVVSSGGSMLLSKAIQNGTSLSTAAKVAHGSIQIGSIAASGVNAGLVELNEDESNLERKVSAQDALNLIASLLLFTNSAVDLHLSRSILRRNQTHLIQDFEQSLRNSRHRKEFCQMVKNTTSLTSNTNSSKQIIRSTAKISNKDLLSSSIVQNEKSFSLKGIEVSSSNGSISIDGKCLMGPLDFVKNFKEKANGVQPIAVVTTNFSLTDCMFEKVLKNFLARYKREFQNSKPSLAQFSYFLKDVSEVDKPDLIFAKLLLIGIKLVRRVSSEKYLVNNILSETVDFLWEFIQVNLREKIGTSRNSEDYRESLMKIIIGVHASVENNMDEWIDSFKRYLKINLKQLRRKNKSDMGKLYLLHVI